MCVINAGETICPICGGRLSHYDTVCRTIKGKNSNKLRIKIKRMRCKKCNTIHRELPENAIPYKQYDINIIEGVIEGLITSDTMGFEDYPCEQTMKRWRNNPPKLFLHGEYFNLE